MKLKTIERIKDNKNWFFGKINRTDKPLVGNQEKKERRHKLWISDMKERPSQLIPWIYIIEYL